MSEIKTDYTSINRDAVYILTDNCRLKVEGNKIASIRGEELLSKEGFLVDNRLRLVSFGTTLGVDTYLNYFDLLARFSNVESTRPELSGRYISMLEMGYIPVVAAPSFMSEKMYNMFLPLLTNSKVDIREVKPYRIDGRSFDSAADDIWASRVGMAEFLGCDIMEVEVTKFLIEVMKRCA